MRKNKADLKARFQKNSIPTEADFADLIESGINQLDDGVKRTPGDPLTIMAVGDTQELLSLSKSFDPKQAPAWKINLNPGVAEAPANPGFNIANAAGGESRLFIDEATGNVGIGNKTPKAKLDVAGDMHVKGALDATGNISTLADINANGLIITKANIYADGAVEGNVIIARDKITAGGAVEANVISVTDKVTVGGAVEANIISVKDKITVGGAVEANIISVKDKVIVGGAVEANVISVKDKVIVGGAVEANVISVKDKAIVGSVEARGVISTDGNIHADGTIDAKGLISTKGDIKADGNIDADKAIHAKGFIKTDAALYVGQEIQVTRDIISQGTISAVGVNIGGREAEHRPPVKLDVHGTIYFEGRPLEEEFYSKQQGGYMNWNINGGTGETTFINNSGDGPGGFMFYNYDGRVAPLVPIEPRYRALLYLKGDKTAEFYGNILINGEVKVTSDIRIKKNIRNTNNAADLDLLSNLKVTDYQHIDTKKLNNQPVKGLIAQQVEEVFPEAVMSKQEFVPDIYATAENVTGAGNTVTFIMGKPHGLQNNDTLKLITPAGEKEKVVTVTGELSFSIEGQADEYKDALVYGKQVDDFRMLDYNRLFVLNISATQQLKIENEQLKAKNEALEAMLAGFEQRLSAIENLKN
jgi:cytoskeletal protein CcmA (bactofilin family)